MISDNQTVKLPAVFGRYILLRRISRGGMGEIFLGKLGEIQGFEKPIIIKKILPELAQDRDFLHRFIEEAQIAIKLTHGNIVPVYEVGMVNNEYFLALEYVKGRDLRTLIKRCQERQERIPPHLCLFLVREIANGLAYAHRHTDDAGKPLDLVHCDISPPNILVSWEGEVKIIDFGIARSAQRRVQEENVGFGKFGYMAPEQLIRGGIVDRRSDIYSTGVLLYELLTGQRLFNFSMDVDYRHVARVVTAGKIISPSERDFNLSDQFDRLVLRALKTNPLERYSTAEEFRDKVQQKLYSMNPTISTDSLAAFMRDIFATEVERDRKMVRSLSLTDMEAFRTELDGASTNTVSFALAGLWSQVTHGGQLDLKKTLPPSTLPFPMQPPESSLLLSGTSGTRKLSQTEQMKAVDVGDETLFTPLAPSPRRAWFVFFIPLVLLAAGGVAVGYIVMNTAPVPEQSTSVNQNSVAKIDRRRQPLIGTTTAREQIQQRERQLTFDPDPILRTEEVEKSNKPTKKKVHQSKKNHHPRKNSHRHKRKRKPKKSRIVRSKKLKEISPTMVQRKFRQVRMEYNGFTKSFGQQLNGHWQKILFANTYGNMDQNKYRRLNWMLDDLRKRMRQIRAGGGGR